MEEIDDTITVWWVFIGKPAGGGVRGLGVGVGGGGRGSGRPP